MSHTISEKQSYNTSSTSYGTCNPSDKRLDIDDTEQGLNVRRLERSYHLALFITLACFSAFGFIAGMAGNRYWTMNTAQFCTQELSQYSPLLEDVDMKYDAVRFEKTENAFRESAGTEVDAAWKSLGIDYRSIVVPSELAMRSDLRSDHVQVSEEYGGGYPAKVNGLQHLSCLNLLRQSLYYNFDHYHSKGEGAFQNEDSVLREQVSQCLDILRQQLMCTVDIGVQGQTWTDPSNSLASADSSVQHKCRNFEAVREWAEQHQMPQQLPEDFLQKPKSRI